MVVPDVTSGAAMSLIGRGHDVASARQMLQRHGLVVVLGQIGVGKSAFAAAVVDDRTAHVGGGLRLLRTEPLRALERAVELDLRTVADVASAVHEAVSGGVLVVDDLQWVDDSSLGVLQQLVGEVDLLLIGRHDANDNAARLFTAVAEPFLLRPLSADDAALLVHRLAPAVPSDRRADALRRCGGRPRLLAELLGAGDISMGTTHDLEQWISGIGSDAFNALLALSLANGTAPVDVASVACRDWLVEHDLVTCMDTPSGPHLDLMFPFAGEMVLAQADEDQRRHAHLQLAGLSGTKPVDAARHLLRGVDTPAAAATARSTLDDTTTTTIVDRADAADTLVEALGESCLDADRLLAASANIAAGRPDRVLALTDQITDHALRAPADLIAGRALRQLGQPLAARLALDAADRDGRDTTVAIERAKIALWADWDPSAASNLLDDVTDDEAVGLRRVTRTLMSPDHGWKEVAEVLGDSSWSASINDELERRVFLIGARLLGADMANMSDEVAALQRRGDQLLIERWRLTATAVAAMVQLHLGGDPSQAVEQLESLGRQASIGDVQPLIGAHLAVGFADFGRNGDALAVLARINDDGAVGATALRSWAGAEVQFSAGRPGGVREALDLASSLAPDLPTQPLVHVVRSWAAFEFDKAAPPMAQPPIVVPAFSGALDECDGIRSLANGEPGAAASSFRRAAQRWAPTHHRGVLRCHWAEGEALRRDGQIDDARAALQAVENDAQQMGMLPLVARVRQSLRRAGISRRSETSPPQGSLTGRERDVLELVGEGLPATAIAQQLGVASSTVETQISSAMRRLGARTRLQAVALMRAQSRSNR